MDTANKLEVSHIAALPCVATDPTREGRAPPASRGALSVRMPLDPRRAWAYGCDASPRPREGEEVMHSADVHVTPLDRGWEVRRHGERFVSSVHNTRWCAVKAAREMAAESRTAVIICSIGGDVTVELPRCRRCRE